MALPVLDRVEGHLPDHAGSIPNGAPDTTGLLSTSTLSEVALQPAGLAHGGAWGYLSPDG